MEFSKHAIRVLCVINHVYCPFDDSMIRTSSEISRSTNMAKIPYDPGQQFLLMVCFGRIAIHSFCWRHHYAPTSSVTQDNNYRCITEQRLLIIVACVGEGKESQQKR
jgi:hypothetical protein